MMKYYINMNIVDYFIWVYLDFQLTNMFISWTLNVYALNNEAITINNCGMYIRTWRQKSLFYLCKTQVL